MLKRFAWIGLLLVIMPIAGFFAGVGLLRLVEGMGEMPALRRGDFSSITAEVGSPVVLLSTSTCPWCQKTREWLKARGVDYRDCVVDQDSFASGLMDRVGGDSVPQLINAEGAAFGYVPEVFDEIVRGATEPALPTVQRCAAPESAASTVMRSTAATRLEQSQQ